MRVQLHCIARIRVVYLKEVDLLASLMYTPSPPAHREKIKCRTGANSSSRKNRTH
uniref:Hypothetical chloroplast RF15 n=1 Tax=Plantago ovata TaxID=185002 RepID=A0A4P8JFU8_PLAOV|nr:hypothetical chloroplast RF15 [Plantago ovata]QCP71002.1 hypothetical chloroplast RF15 [Plantago ovata]